MLSTHNSIGIIVRLIVAAVGTIFLAMALQAMGGIPLLVASVSWNWAMF
jgi:hypothetical protein